MIKAIFFEDSSNLVDTNCLEGLKLRRNPIMEQKGLCFVVKNGALHLVDYSALPPLSYKVDFQRGRLAYRIKSSKKEDLIKAVGEMDSNEKIIDATMGFAEDSILLSQLGAELTAVEQNPFICALVKDALNRLNKKAFEIVCADSVFLLENIKEKPAIIYLDPMFGTAVKRRAKVKKEMQLLQKINTFENDDEPLLNAALKCAIRKVVVKRPTKAKYLNNKKADYSIEGSSVRFDVYRR